MIGRLSDRRLDHELPVFLAGDVAGDIPRGRLLESRILNVALPDISGARLLGGLAPLLDSFRATIRTAGMNVHRQISKLRATLAGKMLKIQHFAGFSGLSKVGARLLAGRCERFNRGVPIR
ncbi:conserved hypothetical protein [Sinorhizobium medicae]|uniref:Uncharacterized protein n=1 Tax=Sinorhizobium medicae TaxID=110321 RepID=A0A508WV83_9HYPH|nr:conserved hypothetical protein [Sinorhizobium medicae]